LGDSEGFDFASGDDERVTHVGQAHVDAGRKVTPLADAMLRWGPEFARNPIMDHRREKANATVSRMPVGNEQPRLRARQTQPGERRAVERAQLVPLGRVLVDPPSPEVINMFWVQAH
jgi:hypothetical protein